ncbi:MAG: aminotransferase class V-fold PLP-dependent enzyme [Elusimicrobiaceae bacterium]|nr:aminotransferase class V-fold PLP-dependent enzyme [Elusimicrobiaceae bacterium]
MKTNDLIFTEDELPTASFSCGPGQGLPSVRNARLYETFFERSHRAADITFDGLYKECTENLRTLLEIPPDYTVLFFPGGVTPAMDAVLWSLAKDTVSGVNIGAFSHLWCADLATRVPGLKRNFVTADEHFLPQGMPDTNASLILLTLNETATGVQLPDDYLQHIWQQRGLDTLVAWDTTSCAGGRKLPKGTYDIQIFGLQKCLGAGGGTCCMVLSPRAVERAQHPVRNLPFFLDLRNALTYTDKFQTLNTPSTINIWMANEACKWMLPRGGISAMEKLCKMHADYLVNWAEKSPHFAPLITDEKYRSFTTLTLAITNPQIPGEKIAEILRATDKQNLADGLKKYRTVTQNSLRIACFPFVDTEGTEQYKKLTAMLDKIAQRLTEK